MAQLNWTYFSLTGMPYSIDMYHGEESGHLILFVNSAIILIDFKQTESKKYSFFIEQQLLEFEIDKKQDTFEYIVTPQPLDWDIGPEKTFDKQFWITLLILIFIILIAFNLIRIII